MTFKTFVEVDKKRKSQEKSAPCHNNADFSARINKFFDVVSNMIRTVRALIARILILENRITTNTEISE